MTRLTSFLALASLAAACGGDSDPAGPDAPVVGIDAAIDGTSVDENTIATGSKRYMYLESDATTLYAVACAELIPGVVGVLGNCDILSYPKAAPTATTLASEAEAVYGLGHDPTGTYWLVAPAPYTIQKLDTAASSPAPLVMGPAGAFTLDGSRIFWSFAASVSGPFGIRSRANDGTGPTDDLVDEGSQHLQVDDANLYWAQIISNSEGSTSMLRRVAKTGGTAANVFSGAPLSGFLSTLRVVGDNLYFAMDFSDIYVVPSAGGSPTMAADVATDLLGGFAIDSAETTIYWIESVPDSLGDHRLMKQPLGDGPAPVQLAFIPYGGDDNLGTPQQLVVDDQHVYFAVGDGRLFRVAK